MINVKEVCNSEDHEFERVYAPGNINSDVSAIIPECRQCKHCDFMIRTYGSQWPKKMERI